MSTPGGEVLGEELFLVGNHSGKIFPRVLGENI